MANPQCEDGYTKIANEILEALARIRIPGEARQILDVILRKIYGFGKKEDRISLSQFVLASGLKKSHICFSIKKLEKMNLIFITEKGNAIANKYCINKDFEAWKPLPKKVTLPKKVMTITQKGNALNRNTKETITKENRTPLTPQRGELPEKLKNFPGFPEIWDEWQKHRREIGHTLKPTTTNQQLKFLSSQPDPVATINQSILHGWQGLFPLKNNNLPTTNEIQKPSKYDVLRPKHEEEK